MNPLILLSSSEKFAGILSILLGVPYANKKGIQSRNVLVVWLLFVQLGRQIHWFFIDNPACNPAENEG